MSRTIQTVLVVAFLAALAFYFTGLWARVDRAEFTLGEIIRMHSDGIEVVMIGPLERNGKRYVVVRAAGEAVEEWANRARRIADGSDPYCETVDCPPYGQIEVCVPCGVSEPPNVCARRLQEAVDAFCAAFNCNCR